MPEADAQSTARKRSPAPFARLCADRGLTSPSVFLAAFNQAALDLGEDVTVTARQFHRWRADNPPCPRLASLRVLHALLGVPPEEMGFPIPDHRQVTDAMSGHAGPTLSTSAGDVLRDGDGPVRRREFFSTSARLGAATLGLAGTPALAESASVDGAVGLAQVRELRRILLSLYALDDAYGADDVLVLGVRHLRRVRRVIDTGSYPDGIGRQLRLVAGETAEHCGWLSFDANRQDHARRFWGDALATARTLGDDGLEVIVLASLSLQARYDDRPREACELARAAQDRAAGWASPKLLSVLVEREADALARMRDHVGARRALARAMRLLERERGSHPTPEWASFQGPAELSQAQGFLFAEAGHYKAAVPYVQAALAQQDSTYGRNRALYRLDLAEMLINSGEVDEGCAETISAAGQFGEVASGRVRSKLATVRRRIGQIGTKAAREAAQRLDQMNQQKEGTKS